MKPILREAFWYDGRGPELKQVHLWGSVLRAIDYENPERSTFDDNMHLLFIGSQSFQFTPEEVYAYSDDIDWSATGNAAIIDLGKSEWLNSFDQRHMSNRHHYKIMFYDEILDLICEHIVPTKGLYSQTVDP